MVKIEKIRLKQFLKLTQSKLNLYELKQDVYVYYFKTLAPHFPTSSKAVEKYLSKLTTFFCYQFSLPFILLN